MLLIREFSRITNRFYYSIIGFQFGFSYLQSNIEVKVNVRPECILVTNK